MFSLLVIKLYGCPRCGLHESFCCNRLTTVGSLACVTGPWPNNYQSLPYVEPSSHCWAGPGHEEAGWRALGGEWFPGPVLTHWCAEPGSVVSSCGTGGPGSNADLTVGNAASWLVTGSSLSQSWCQLLAIGDGFWGGWLKGLTCSKVGAGLLMGWLGPDMAGCWTALVLGLMSAD